MINKEFLGALHDALGDATMEPIAADLCIRLPTYVDQLAEVSRSGTRADLRALAHRLRGQAAMLGCRGLSAALESLEKQASAPESSVTAIGSQIEAIPPIAHATMMALQAFADQRPSNQPAANAATMATHQIQLDDPVAAGCGAEAAGAAGAACTAPVEADSGCAWLASSVGATAGA